MGDDLKATGFRTNCMAKVCIRGLMAEAMKESIKTIKNMALEFILGQTARNMKANG